MTKNNYQYKITSILNSNDSDASKFLSLCFLILDLFEDKNLVNEVEIRLMIQEQLDILYKKATL